MRVCSLFYSSRVAIRLPAKTCENMQNAEVEHPFLLITQVVSLARGAPVCFDVDNR